MADEQTQNQDQRTETATEDSEQTPAPPVRGPMTPGGDGALFTPAQQEYLGRLVSDERKKALQRFQESDEFKTLKAKARRADELEGQGREEVEQMSEALAKAKAERAAALSKAEHALMRAQFVAIASQRGIPADRIQDAIVLADTREVKVNLDAGEVTGAEDAVQHLIETRPWLVGPGIAPQQTQRERPAPNLNGGATGSPASDEARIAAVMQEMAARGGGRI